MTLDQQENPMQRGDKSTKSKPCPVCGASGVSTHYVDALGNTHHPQQEDLRAGGYFCVTCQRHYEHTEFREHVCVAPQVEAPTQQFTQGVQVPLSSPAIYWWTCRLCGTATAGESAPSSHVCENPNGCNEAEAPTPTLQEFWNAQSEWSQATFGTDAERGPIGPLKHLEKEAREAQEHPTDPFEFADCLFLVFDSARRAGFTLDQLTRFCWQKLEINKQRKYPKTTDMNAAVEHER
jgi:hypothetical protein